MPKMSTEERERVKGIVTELYLRGVISPSRIRQLLADFKGPKTEQHPKGVPLPIEISIRQVFRYLEGVRADMKKSSKFDRDEQMGKSLARKETLYRKAMEKGEHNLARQVQNDTDRLLGLIIEHHEHTGKIGLEDWLLEDEREREKAARDKRKADEAAAKKSKEKTGDDPKDSPPPKKPIVASKPQPEQEPPGDTDADPPA